MRPHPSGALRTLRHGLAVLIAASLLQACSKQGPNDVAPVQNSDPNLVQPGPEFSAQLTVSPVTRQSIAETLRVAGRIEFDDNRVARIGASITGRVTDIDAVLGQTVRRGDVLARLNSSELSNLQLAYLKARAQLELSRRNAERAKVLFEADVIGAAELQRRESENQVAQAEAQALADQLQLLGVSKAAIAKLSSQGTVVSVTPVVSTLDGVVVERTLAQGQVVQPSETLFTVADISRVWAVAQIPEQQVARVKPGQSVSIEVPALGNEKIIGKLIYVSQTVDPQTRTVLARTELDNSDRRLKPAMLASMLIEAAPVDTVVVPASAVVREDNEDHVFVAQDKGAFRLVKVKLGPESNKLRVVQSGLKGDEKIVVDGAFHLNNERNRKEMEGQ